MSQQFIIKYEGKYPVRLVWNVAGRVFALVSEEEATRFPARGEATTAAFKHGIQGGFTVEPESIISNVCPVCKKVHQPFCTRPNTSATSIPGVVTHPSPTSVSWDELKKD